MADWVAISSLATAGGTLALALATYGSVRSANRSARVAEMALREQRRPVLVNSRVDDRRQGIGFADGRWLDLPGGSAAIETTDVSVYLALSLRNVGAGLAVLQGWHAATLEGSDGESESWTQEAMTSGTWSGALTDPAPVDEFRELRRDQYIPAGDLGIWQGAVRDAADPMYQVLTSASSRRQPIFLDLLYTDQVGDQHTISRFGLLPEGDEGWRLTASRHWYLDAAGPR